MDLHCKGIAIVGPMAEGIFDWKGYQDVYYTSDKCIMVNIVVGFCKYRSNMTTKSHFIIIVFLFL